MTDMTKKTDITKSKSGASSLRPLQSYCLTLALPVVLFGFYWATRPYSDVVAAKTVSMNELSVPQRMNINLAARYLDGVTVKPGENFAFNRVIGPRTEHRGYVGAPSYVGKDTPTTTGGGICLLSSCVYQIALESGMTIKSRTPHLRTIHTVAPGLDATVWYGRADLIFENNTSSPIQFHAFQDGSELKVELLGTKADIPKCTLRTYQKHVNKDHVCVRVVRSGIGPDQTVSEDLYGLSVANAGPTGH